MGTRRRNEGPVITPSEVLALDRRGHRLTRVIGEGSYARVLLAEVVRPEVPNDKKMKLACKVIDVELAPKEFVKKFLPRELDILTKVSHPHIIYVHSIFQRQSKYFVFMRLADRGDLLEYIVNFGEVGEKQAREWTRQLGLGLQYLHEMEIAHRDLKCENVLLTGRLHVKLTDFGFARYVVDGKGRPELSETFCGSLSYAAPEILRGLPYDPKPADLWSLGCVLFTMLNRCLPFEDYNTRHLYEQQMRRKLRYRSRVSNKLTPQLRQLLAGMLEPDSAKRHTVDNLLASHWLNTDLELRLTPSEKRALSSAKDSRASLPATVLSLKRQLYRPDQLGPVDSDGVRVLKSSPLNEDDGKSYDAMGNELPPTEKPD